MELEEWVHQIGLNIRNQRKNLDLTQEQLAELADVDTSYIGQIERGLREPSLKILWRLSVVLHLPLSGLLTIEDKDISVKTLEELGHLLEGLSEEEQGRLLQMVRLFLGFQR